MQATNRAGQGPPRSPAWRGLCLVAAGTCYFLAWTMFAIFIIWTFIQQVPRWTWVYDDPSNLFQQLREKAETYKYKMLDGYVYFYGWDVKELAFWWAPAVICAICVVLVSMIPKDALKTSSNTISRAWRKVKRAAAYPMPPYNFWLNWCDGLDAKDVLLHAIWFTFHVVQLWDMVPYMGRRSKGWDAAGLYWHVPKSVYKLEWISLAFSWALYTDLALMFFPIAHNHFIHKLLGTNFSAALRWHRWLSHYMLLTLTGHGVFYYLYWLCNPDTNFWKEFFDWNGTSAFHTSSINYFAGTLAFLFGVIIWVSSVNYVRRYFFKVFYSLHIFGFAGFLIFAQVHYYWNWTCLAPGLVFYALDVVFRTFQAQHVSVVSSAHITSKGLLARIVVPIDVKLAQKMRAGHDVFLQFPTISRWSWHPFTVFKVTQGGGGVQPSMTVVIKKYGRWTQTMIEHLKMGAALPVRVTGPFGGIDEVDAGSVSRVVLFLGGVGATAALALLHNMVSDAAKEGQQPPPTTLVFTAREMEEFTVLDDELVLASRPEKSSWLQVALHHTGAAPAPKEQQACSLDPQSSSSSSDNGLDKEAPNGQQVLANRGARQDSSAAPVTAAPRMSAFFWNRVRPVEPKYHGPAYVLVAILLAWLGAFLGLIQATSGINEYWWTWTDNKDSGLMGLLILACITVQAIGLPVVLLVLPAHIFRYIRSRREHVVPMSVAEPMCCYAQVLGDTSVGVPGGASIAVQRGRPDVQAVLEAAARTADPSKEVLVVVAGPRTLVHQVSLAAWGMNKGRGAAQPYLRVAKETYEL